MNIKSTFLYTSINTIVKIISGLILNKAVAVYLGPSGSALVGQFQNFIGLAVGVGSASINTGVLTYTAKYKDDQNKRELLWKNALLIQFFCILLVSLVVVFFSEQLSQYFLYDKIYSKVFVLFSMALVCFVLNITIAAIVNGLQEIGLLIVLGVFSSLISLVVGVSLILCFGLVGVLCSFIFSQIILLVLGVLFVKKLRVVNFVFLKEIFNSFDRNLCKNLLTYSVVTFSTGLNSSIMMLMMRYLIQKEASLVYAGYWESAYKISTYFLMMSVLPISVYFLPKFASSTLKEDVKKTLYLSIRIFLPIQILAGIAFYLNRGFFVELLFSNEFEPVNLIIGYVLSGDVLRLASISIMNLFLARKKMKQVVFIDSLFAVIFVSLVYFLYSFYGFSSIGLGYLLSAIITLFFSVLLINRHFKVDY